MIRNLLSLCIVFFSLFSVNKVSSQKKAEIPDHYGKRQLMYDLKLSDAVAHVDVKELQTVDKLGGADCENNTGNGYCLYLLTAEVKEVFKGEINTGKLEFYVGPDASYPKKYLLGEQVVFLVASENEKTKKRSFSTIENSTRQIEYGVVETLRNILDPNSAVDDEDESDPYSLKSIKKDFKKADAIIYADVVSFKPDSEVIGMEAFVLKADVKEVFKGNLKAGQQIEYKDDLLYRPIQNGDLGKQVLYLEKSEENGKVIYKRIWDATSEIKHDILEKLRKVAKLNGKN